MKLGLTLEGGAHRTYFSIGIMDFLLEKNIKIRNEQGELIPFGKAYHEILLLWDKFTDDEIQQYKSQLKILLRMVELGYSIPKSKSEVEKEFERLKAKANTYNIKQ